MSTAPGEQQVLAEIESRLRRSDPALAARLALFRRHAGRGRGAARAPSPSGGPRRRLSAVNGVIVLLAAVLLAVVIIGLLACFRQPHRAAAAIREIPAARRQAQPLSCPAAGSRASSAAASLCISARVTLVSLVTSQSPTSVSSTLATRASSGSG
jgi:cytochrome c-type biogenesis protein CcmH/NrfG